MTWAYYNEFDPFAASWLRELIKAGHIAPGYVDERSIEDVRPDDLSGFAQCHFFAGIGVWSYALRRIGVPDDYRIWTGSCPCQPFSAAGKGDGFADERHLWPAFFHLITQVEPLRIVGEQVASKDGLAWLDLVQADMEGAGHAFGAVDLCAAGVGAPHIRQRLWWVGKRLANAASPRPLSSAYPGVHSGEESARPRDAELERPCASSHMEHAPSDGREQWGSEPSGRGAAGGCGVGGLDHHHHPRLEGQRGGYQAESGRDGKVRPVAKTGEFGGVGDAGTLFGAQAREHGARVAVDGGLPVRLEHASTGVGVGQPGPTNGLWRDADWLFCRDGKWRPVIPSPLKVADGLAPDLVRVCDQRGGLFAPLEEKAPARVGRLRGYGNAIVAPVAEEFLRAALLDEPVNSAV